MRPAKIISASLVVALLSGCSMAPDFALPKTDIPQQFKELPADGVKWQAASKDAGKPDQSQWWQIFNDPELNALEAQAMQNSPNLQRAFAQVQQARAVMRQARAGLLPQVNAGANAGRNDLGATARPATNYSVNANIAYEVDLFGRLGDAEAAAKLDAAAADDLYHQTLLILQADVAQNYFALRSLDSERALLEKTVGLRQDGEKLLKARFDEGEENEQEYLRAKAELATTQADLTALNRQRSLTEHALALLLGKNANDVNLATQSLPQQLPKIPAGVPSQILERRPDIAAAEARLAAANKRIGVAKAAFYPSLNLTATGGFAAPELGDLFQSSSKAWVLGQLFLGNALSVPIFDGGRRKAQLAFANAAYQEQVANYRQSVLVAFKEVEDSLVNLARMGEQAQFLYTAAEAAGKAGHLSDLRYREGETSFLEVIQTQRDALNAQRAYTQVQGQRFIQTIALIRALGGGWPLLTLQTQAPVTAPAVVPQPAAVKKEVTPPVPVEKPMAKKTAIVPLMLTNPVAEKPAAKPEAAQQPTPVVTAPASEEVPPVSAQDELAPRSATQPVK